MDSKQTCSATSKRTHERCKNYPRPGAVVCRFHSGEAPQVERKAAIRVALREALERGDRRPVWEILLDTVHAADVLMRDARATLGDNGEVTLEQLDRFVESVERASRLSKVTLDAKAQEHGQQYIALQMQLMARPVEAALRALDLSHEQEVVARGAMRAELMAIEAENRGVRMIEGTTTG